MKKIFLLLSILFTSTVVNAEIVCQENIYGGVQCYGTADDQGYYGQADENIYQDGYYYNDNEGSSGACYTDVYGYVVCY